MRRRGFARVRAFDIGTGAALIVAGIAGSIATPSTLVAQTWASEALEVADGLGWIEGETDAPVTIVEFTDVSCPYCASFHAGTRAELVQEFVESGNVRWITLTYISELYPNSDLMSPAAECAGHQGKYQEFLAAIYAERDTWVGARDPQVIAEIERFARDLDLDEAAFDACQRDPDVHERIETVGDLATQVGVRGTPTWFVDGFLVMGDLPLGYARQFIVTRLGGDR